MRQPMSTSTKNEGRTVTSQLIPIASNSSIKSFAAAAAVVEQKLLQKQNSKISNNQGISFLATIRNGFIQLVKVSGTKYDQLAKCKSKGFLLNVLCMEFPLVKRLTMMLVLGWAYFLETEWTILIGARQQQPPAICNTAPTPAKVVFQRTGLEIGEKWTALIRKATFVER